MYDDKNKINSMYFKKNNKKYKKHKKLNKYICITLMLFIFFLYLNINFKYSYKQQEKFIQNRKHDDLLPPKPKEKWKYIQKLEHL